MSSQSAFVAWLRRSGWVLLLIALVPFALHLWTNAHDNIFRDEMYYVAAGHHLDFGYVDFPPFVAVVAAVSQALLGMSVIALRLLPALAGVCIVLLTADMVAMLGGGLAAQALAAVAIAVGPVFIGSSGLLTMDPFDQLWWTLAAWLLIRMIRGQQPRLWLVFGLVAGVGLLTKLTMGFWVIALVIGLLLSQSRKLLFTRWLVFGGLLALVLISPYLVWQVTHGLPALEFTAAYSSGKTFQVTPAQFFIQQLITTNPIALPLWLAGLYFVFFVPSGRPYRTFGWAYVLLYVFFMLQKAKFYWLSPAYPPLFACGAFALETIIARQRPLVWLRPSIFIWPLAISGLLFVPFSLPMLPPEEFIKVNALVGGAGEVKQESLQSSALPQNFADRYGWREMVADIKQAYDTLTPAEKAEACILTANYGEAAAVDFYGPALGLPKAISGHNSYYLWGPRGCSGKVIISIGRPLEDLSGSFDSVEARPPFQCNYCMPHENGAPIFIARGLKFPLQQVWPAVKSYG